jgi:hypothetical protein
VRIIFLDGTTCSLIKTHRRYGRNGLLPSSGSNGSKACKTFILERSVVID